MPDRVAGFARWKGRVSQLRRLRDGYAAAIDPVPPFQDAVTDDEPLNFGPHEASKGVLRTLDNGFAPHIEAGIDQDRATCALFERGDQCPIPWIGDAIDGVDPCRIVDMRNGGYFGPPDIQPVDAEELVFLAETPPSNSCERRPKIIRIHVR